MAIRLRHSRGYAVAATILERKSDGDLLVQLLGSAAWEPFWLSSARDYTLEGNDETQHTDRGNEASHS